MSIGEVLIEWVERQSFTNSENPKSQPNMYSAGTVQPAIHLLLFTLSRILINAFLRADGELMESSIKQPYGNLNWRAHLFDQIL